MTMARRRFRRRLVGGVGVVLDPHLEETLVFGAPVVFGPSFSTLRFHSDWQREWDRWRDTILPKALEARPGKRPFAMYAVGEIPPRPVRVTPPTQRRFEVVVVGQRDGTTVSHYLNAPAVYVKPEIDHLVDLGIVDGEELERFRAWQRQANPDCEHCLADRYQLEMALHE